ncbi:hypothetical protein [Ruminococcus flavefaciens]|uniref:hypothetical protein n=1 Tax=Ruminococcus flavefaciens TaxID=1265 RepID=UPI0026ED5A17|nr:hypothetical protein [Ruminococcus flavefaciens]
MKHYNDFLIVGIDHGYGNIKIANTVTPTGITKLDAAPTFTKNTLFFEGSYYQIGEGHKEYLADKWQDEDNYIFTLTVTAVDYSGAFTDMQSKRTSGTDYNAEYSTLSTGYICINQRIMSRKMTKKKLILAKKRREKSNQVKNNQTKAKLRSK